MQFTVDQPNKFTLTIVYTKALQADYGERLEMYNINRFRDDNERTIRDVISDLGVDIANGMVAAGQVELTDDVEEKDSITYDGIYASGSELVYCHERTITWNHDLPESATAKAIEDARNWLAKG